MTGHFAFKFTKDQYYKVKFNNETHLNYPK